MALHHAKSVDVSLTGARTIVLNAGDWPYLERAKEHGAEALEDSTLLLTIPF
jgi:quercetin dioxygenase-like cupin family protein